MQLRHLQPADCLFPAGLEEHSVCFCLHPGRMAHNQLLAFQLQLSVRLGSSPQMETYGLNDGDEINSSAPGT